jgi:predicted regulator of Ras-like GTPase activity (Roadblock/LC7/MglB family)
MESGEMENILKDINVVVGVTGSFVCDAEGQLLAKALPGVFDEAVLSPVGRTMAQTMAGLELARRRRVSDLDVVYRDGRLVVKNLRLGLLCILCVPTINIPLLNLTANVAARKLIKLIKGDQAEPAKKPAPRVAEAPPPPQAGTAAGPTVNGDFFSDVEQELTRLMGPMATFVLDEHITALGEMREAFPRDKAHQLIERLVTEIDGDDRKAEFEQVVLEILEKTT